MNEPEQLPWYRADMHDLKLMAVVQRHFPEIPQNVAVCLCTYGWQPFKEDCPRHRHLVVIEERRGEAVQNGS